MPVAAVVFDLYGTILAIEGMRGAVAAAGVAEPDAFVRAGAASSSNTRTSPRWRSAYRDFDELTALALEHTCAHTSVALDARRPRELRRRVRD